MNFLQSGENAYTDSFHTNNIHGLYPNQTQIKTIGDILYLSRKLYNTMLEQRNDLKEKTKDSQYTTAQV